MPFSFHVFSFRLLRYVTQRRIKEHAQHFITQVGRKYQFFISLMYTYTTTKIESCTLFIINLGPLNRCKPFQTSHYLRHLPFH